MSVQWVETCASPLLCVDYLYKYAEVHATFKTITILDARCNSSTPIRYIYIYGGIHGWGTTFGCVTEKGLFLISSHAWYA